MTGYRDPFNRAYSPWGREDKELQAYIRDLAHLKAGSDVLRRGNVQVLQAGNGRISFRRTLEGKSVTLYCNRTDEVWDIKPQGKCLFGDPQLPPMSVCALEDE